MCLFFMFSLKVLGLYLRSCIYDHFHGRNAYSKNKFHKSFFRKCSAIEFEQVILKILIPWINKHADFNPFVANALISYSLKTAEKPQFFLTWLLAESEISFKVNSFLTNTTILYRPPKIQKSKRFQEYKMPDRADMDQSIIWNYYAM